MFMLDAPNHISHPVPTEYENYDATSKAYDNTRSPVGVEVMLGCFASTPRPLHEQTIHYDFIRTVVIVDKVVVDECIVGHNIFSFCM